MTTPNRVLAMLAHRRVRFAPSLVVTALAALACSAPERATAPATDLPTSVTTQISDATGGGEPHFYWLPPIAPPTSYAGTFDGTVNPELRLCRLTGTVCAALLATYTRSSSPAIVVSTSQRSYSLTWATKPASITNGDYRAEVWVAGRRLGLADARVVSSAKDLKSVPAGFVGVQKGKTLAFTFRLEQGIIASIAVTPNRPTVEVGATVQLSATVRDIHGAVIVNAPVTWSSSSAAVATVSSTGLVTGVTEDTVIVSAASGDVFANDTVAVVRPRVDQVVVNPSGSSVAVGQTTTLWATLYDARGNIITGRPVTWSSSNASVATVSQSGVVTGVAAGSVSIAATSEGRSGNAPVTVTPPVVDHVVVAPQLASLTVGQTAAFTATAFDAVNNPIPDRAFTWLTGDTAVITIAPDGVATAVGPGLAYVEGMTGVVSDSAFVEVTGATVTCLRPWALPELWFISNPYGRAVRARHGLPDDFASVPAGTISGNYYPITLGESGAGVYRNNIIACSSALVTLGAPNPLAFGNLVGATIQGLDSLFKLDPGATWDSTANGGLGAIVSSNAPPGAESPRVVLVGLYVDRDHSPGTSSVRFRRTAWVFVDTYSRTTNFDANEVVGDIVFRFLRFGP